MLTIVVGGLALLLAGWIGILLWYARPLVAFWREPALKVPVLILESDDWGPAPPDHAEMLSAIARLLAEYSDRRDHHPVMTLAVVLAIPEPGQGASDTPRELTMADPRFRPVVEAMQAGVRDGVFQLQLHGRSHYWLPALVEAASTDPAVAGWLAGPDTWHTEALPAELQSRWEPRIGGKPFTISDEAARSAAEHDARLFHECFGTAATIAVPTRFDWYPALERGWAAAGVHTVVTPGRYDSHSGQFGDPASFKRITNGMRSEHVGYVVRDQYFEPFKGHTAEHGLRALETNTALGRPTLLETHRANFLEPALRDASLSAIRALLEGALARFPDLRFLSTEELVRAMAARSGDLLDESLRGRLHAWLSRVRTLHRFWKLARLSGLALVLIRVEKLVRQEDPAG
jgi:hypothetical protein